MNENIKEMREGLDNLPERIAKEALSKNPMIYHRGERRARRVLRLFQSLLMFSGAFAFSVCSAVKFNDLAISLENSTVPVAQIGASISEGEKCQLREWMRKRIGGGIKASLLHVLGEGSRNLYITLFLFLQKRKPVLKEKKWCKMEMNRKAYIVGRRNNLYSSVSS